jgi:hypothetical protein
LVLKAWIGFQENLIAAGVILGLDLFSKKESPPEAPPTG